MIQLSRNRAAIPASFIDPDRRPRLLELFRAARDGTIDEKAVKKKLFSSSRWSPAKKQLELECNGKCAFCEAPTSATYFGDVEHFRPKELFWWFAYCYDNYLYSCRVCNGKKSDQHLFTGIALAKPTFPLGMSDDDLLNLATAVSPSPSDAAAIAQLSTLLDSESASLPNPYHEDPEKLFVWEADEVLKEVRIRARTGHPRATVALQAVEQILGLNRAELLIWRWRTYSSLRRLRTIAEAATGTAKAETLDILRELAESTNPFSAMVRYFAREKWQLI